MDKNIKQAFDNLVENNDFQELVKEYRFRFGIPETGFNYSNPKEYESWINDARKKTDFLKDAFLFIAKRCRNLIPHNEPIPLVMLASYFLFNAIPINKKDNNECIFSITPSGILGNFDLTFTMPFIFTFEEFLKEIDKHKGEVQQLSDDTQKIIAIINQSDQSKIEMDPTKDFLATTPGSGSGIVDRVHRDMAYLVEFGRVILREHIIRMKDPEFAILKYEDKNKPISSTVQLMGTWLLNRNLYSIAEEYWKHIDNEIVKFNKTNKKTVNRGIPLANQGVAQIAQGKVIEGLFNLYKAYKNDEESLRHLPNSIIDPEKDLPQSTLFTQFESRQMTKLFHEIVEKYPQVFSSPVTESDLKQYILSLEANKKILLFVTLYRFSFSYELNCELSNPVNRGEILRSLSELALWYEDELKRKDTSLSGTLGNFMDSKVGTLNSTSGEYTRAGDLDELERKIKKAITDGGALPLINARIITCLRNYTGHNVDTKTHSIFNMVDEIMARIISLILYNRSQGWI